MNRKNNSLIRNYNANSRTDSVLAELKQRGYISIKDLAVKFGVSEMTIRRDFKVLSKNGKNAITNINGTLVYESSFGQQNRYELDTEQVKNNDEKKAIGKFAASLVSANDIIIIDTGTTTAHIAANLSANMEITAVCYNSNILMQLLRFPNIRIKLAGGDYHANTQLFESSQGVSYIRETRAHKVFVSAAGIHKDLGLTCIEGYETETKKAVLQSAAQKILVADYTKFGVICSAYFCDLQEVDTIITNKALHQDWVQFISDKGIKLHLV